MPLAEAPLPSFTLPAGDPPLKRRFVTDHGDLMVSAIAVYIAGASEAFRRYDRTSTTFF
jgi:hypothetical protein